MNFARGFGFSLLDLVFSLINLYMWAIIIRALLSFVSPDPSNPLVRFLYRITEPVLKPLRALAPPHKIGIDLSPLFALLLIRLIVYTLRYAFYYS
jgi:YggT family protein